MRTEQRTLTDGSTEPASDVAKVSRPSVLVWDVAIRLFHWSLVASVLTAWFTGGSGNRIHEIAGSAVAALLAFRLIWGLIGTRYARFVSFVVSPGAARRYLSDVIHNRAERHVGHNPAGGYMILLMLAALTVAAATGFMQLTNRFYGIEWVETVHHYAANGLMLLVPIHLLGVIASSWMHQENLVAAMIKGDKPVDTTKDSRKITATSNEDRLHMRSRASQGMSALLFLVAGGIASGFVLTSGRQATPVVASDAKALPFEQSGSVTAVTTGTGIASPSPASVPVTEPATVAPSPRAPSATTPTTEIAASVVAEAEKALSAAQRNEVTLTQSTVDKGGSTLPSALVRAIQAGATAASRDRQDYVAGGPEDASQAWLLSSGGRLYDNWYQALGITGPQTTHPNWPVTNTNQSGAVTWRCKSCHGWDYLGRDGQYRSGPNATGYIGVQRLRGRDPAVIMSILGNATHQMSDDILPPHAKFRIAAFISRGQHDATKITLSDGRVKGEVSQGKPLFQSLCAACHGFDGRARKLGNSNEQISQFVGTKARNGPVEVLHKIRNGHPGAIMVFMRPFSMDTAANLLAYARTLPDR